MSSGNEYIDGTSSSKEGGYSWLFAKNLSSLVVCISISSVRAAMQLIVLVTPPNWNRGVGALH
jgi:hypothetical protein